MENFKTIQTEFEGLSIIERGAFQDSRGIFEKIFSFRDLSSIINNFSIEQINLSKNTSKGTLRGLHYQLKPYEEYKIVTCLKGKIFDVAVDLRENSKTYLKHFNIILKENDNLSICIPVGFAHGFQTLANDSHVLYLQTGLYSPIFEAGVNALDPLLSIKWPIQISNFSSRDKKLPFLTSSKE